MRIVIDLQACQSTGSRNRGIGRYSLALAQAMARHAGQHELWLVLNGAFADTIDPLRKAFADLVPSERIRVWSTPGPVAEHTISNDWRRRAGEILREQVLAELRPDIVHVASLFEGFSDDAITNIDAMPEHLPTAVTLYDLIPLVHSRPYLENRQIRDWYYRKLHALKNADLLLSISEASRQEALAWLDLPHDRIVNISSAVDTRFKPYKYAAAALTEVRLRYGLVRPFVMYTGGIDHRKNLDALIRAYAALPQPLRKQFQLAIVCSAQAADRERLQKIAHSAGLANDDVVLTGYVPDDELPMLYNDCALFVFPSWHEGFGLPALEAMACGAPVIGADTSSLPEVIGRHDALFNPRSEKAITEKLHQALSDGDFRASLRAHGLAQSRKFSWDTSAKKALAAIEEDFSRRRSACLVSTGFAMPKRKPTLAYVSPLPPERSGIADYSADLLRELARHYDIELIGNQSITDDPWLAANFLVRDWKWFDAHADRFDRILYQFGNSTFHGHMFNLLARHPGVVVLHDFFLSGILAHLEFKAEMPGGWGEALYASHGYKALWDRTHATHARDVIMQYPCNAAVINCADGVIVHARYSMQLAQQWYGATAADSWALIPLLRRSPANPDRAAVRGSLNLGENDFLICSFGLLGPTKLNKRLLQAWLDSPLAQDPHCHLVFVGENHEGDYGAELSSMIAAGGCAERIKITGFADPELFHRYLAAADTAVQLRTLSRGETSAAVLDCMAYGIPTIINAHGAMAELPDHALIKLPDEFTGAELSEKLAALRSKPEWRRSLGNLAAEFVRCHHGPASIGAQYIAAIERFAERCPNSRRHRTIAAIAAIESPVAANDADLAGIASCLSASYNMVGLRQLLIDVTDLVREDVSADDRVDLRNIVLALIVAPPAGYRVEPVLTTNGGLRYARRFTCGLLGIPLWAGYDDPVETRSGDVYVGLSPGYQALTDQRDLLNHLRAIGVSVYLTIHDVVPIQNEAEDTGSSTVIKSWQQALAAVADGVLCTSDAVADTLSAWRNARATAQGQLFKIGRFQMDEPLADAGNIMECNESSKQSAAQLCEIIFEQRWLASVGNAREKIEHEALL